MFEMLCPGQVAEQLAPGSYSADVLRCSACPAHPRPGRCAAEGGRGPPSCFCVVPGTVHRTRGTGYVMFLVPSTGTRWFL